MPAPEPILDTIVRLETPEGIDLAIRPAGPVARGLALALDLVFRQAGLAIVGSALALLGQMGVGLYLILVFAVEWFYPVFFEVLAEGQTPGKRATGLRVIHADGTPIGWGASVVRNLLSSADFLPLFYTGGLISMSLSSRFQRLGDLAAGTLVIHSAASAAPPERAGDARAEGERSLPIAIDADGQRAVLGFSERYTRFSPERAAELAEILAELTGARGSAAVREVLRVANGIEGRR